MRTRRRFRRRAQSEWLRFELVLLRFFMNLDSLIWLQSQGEALQLGQFQIIARKPAATILTQAGVDCNDGVRGLMPNLYLHGNTAHRRETQCTRRSCWILMARLIRRAMSRSLLNAAG